MTAILDPPTHEATGLGTENWEVVTSLPMSVTAPPAIDFIIMSHAEQLNTDFPVQAPRPDETLAYLANYARRDMGMRELRSGVLFWQGSPVTGFIDSESFSRNLTTSQVLRSLLADFVQESSGIGQLAQRDLIEQQLEQFPIPTFRSPPGGWTKLGQLAGTGSALVATGYSTWNEQPVMAVASAATAFAIWFVTPGVKVARRSFTERVGRWTGTDVKPEDYT